MLEKLLKEYKNYTDIVLGESNRYHTVYYIEFETGQYYIGKHTSSDVINDRYIASSNLVDYLISKNLKFNRTIMFYLKSSDDAIKLETEILSNKFYYDNPNNINCYPGSPPDSTGTVIISYKNKFKMINPALLEMYLSMGWEKKGIKRLWVNNEIDSKFILPDELHSYISNGWNLGNLNSRGRIFIVKDSIRKYIKKEFLNDYIQEGWEYKHNVTGRKVLKKDGKIIKVSSEKEDTYKQQGYVNASTVDGLICLRKNKLYKRVKPDKVSELLNDGWSLGNNTTGKVYISNGVKEKRIYEDELINYPGWYLGRLSKIYINNGIVENRIDSINQDKIDNYLSNGFTIGKLTRPKKYKIYKGDKIKCVLKHEISSFEKEGWITNYNGRII